MTDAAQWRCKPQSERSMSRSEIRALLDDSRSAVDLQRYFHAAGPSAFTGGQFERLGGGGDRPECRDVVTAEDLIAVELLSVRVPPSTALELLQGRLGEDVSAELAQIPTSVRLGSADAVPLMDKGGHADCAWRLLRKADGIGWVVAGKVLARKRPRLVPVYDEVVSCAFRTGKGFWCWLHERLREEDHALEQQLVDLGVRAGVPSEVTPLRVLDVVVWMRHRDGHRGYRCPGLR
ncbi:DUF6308 family protein [Micromonospora sp. NPDC002717]|uniref:DUF6308 family protein n=1 Tax=Micromonospora sp. NPDC002717 TaxID=3154424 RepID=UPI0033326D80